MECEETEWRHRHDAPITLSSSPAPVLGSESSQRKRSFFLIDHDEDESERPYDPAKEALPKKEVNHRAFAEAEEAANGIPAEILAIIDEQHRTNEDITYIKDLAKKAISPNYPEGVKVGLRGDSGTGQLYMFPLQLYVTDCPPGKSSLINSLLGMPNIAPQSDDGGACTSVVQEFHKPRPNQLNACEAEIFFLTPAVRLTILQQWLKDVYNFEHSDAEPGDDAFEGVEQAASTAVEGLFSLFCNHDECSSQDAVRNFVATAKSQDDAGIISKLKGWTEELLQNLQASPGKVVISDTSPEMMQHKIAPYLQHEVSDHDSGCCVPSPWPFVKLVKTYFDSPILSQDIVLVDLPGTSDTNQTRVRASLQYLQDVQFIGVVAKVDRVETDADTHRYLIDAFRRKRGASVLMVATGSDSVNIRPTQLMKRISAANAVDAANLTTLKEQFDMSDLELKNITKEMNAARSRRDRDAVEDLSERKGIFELQKASLEASISEYCIKMRNLKVTRKVREKYLELTKDPVSLPMFCVSNSEYATHALGYDKKYPPKMSVSVTGIPDLRAYLYALPALRKLRAFEHHRKVVLPSLLNNLEMTCSQTKLMRRDELQKILSGAPEPVADEIENVFKVLLETAIIPGITAIKTNKIAYAEHAIAQLSNWKNWANSTHKAFCLHKGNWRTKKVGKQDWNREMLEPLIKAVEKDMRAWDDASSSLASSLSERLCAIVNELISRLEVAAGSSKNAMKLYFDELRIQNRELDLLCQERAEKVEKDLGIIKERITDTDDTTECYFVKIMDSTYIECGSIIGKSARENRANLMKNKLAEKVRGPFLELFKMAKSDCEKIIQQHTKKLTQEVMEIFARFSRTFMRSFKTDEDDTPEVKALREVLRYKVADWRTVLSDDVARHLNTCAEYAQRG
ncbi:tat pathway signal sequence [Diplodia corticola]|uniref:Tat pathway signal sequence n=1 Tax=Diplodia corticola TaxID=236234 RepID=A0A1J9QYN0_9PEZI|nr:tat pathway signal sequence [Diplodia corticola]OJD34166.1 tat pathway signal sequence [Diplodia corticola]